ncbi:MAG TPA: glycosyltransferase [bacterium]|nr:glycosyltransferase [bacterium]
MKKKKIAFICSKGLETFIEPIVQEFEKIETYHSRRYYVNSQQEIIAAVKWADYVFLEWANEIAVIATQIYDIKKKGVIVRLHSYESLVAMPTKIDWSVVDYLVFVAPHIREILSLNIPDIRKRVCTKIIHNGIDIDNTQLNKELNPYNIAYVCNINHRKGSLLALQIMYELIKINPGYKLHVAGKMQEKHYEIYMKHMAREMGIADNILYYGFVDNMDEFWENKGAILSTSIHEGHPVNIIEGMARGLQPVIHNFFGAKDLYPDHMVFNTVNEAIDLITRNPNPMHLFSIPEENLKGEYFRHVVIEKGWTRQNQIKQFVNLIRRLGRKTKK